jgi:hypothetical protein
MSVDHFATLPRPVSLAAVVDSARATLTELLALAAPPDLSVTHSVIDEQRAAIRPGRPLLVAELHDVVFGRPGGDQDVLITAGGEDAAWLMDGEFHPHGEEGMVLSVSPSRTCVGVALATAVALAAALVSGGDFIDGEIRMLRPAVRDPRSVVDRTRLTSSSPDLASAAEKYLRQFPHLGGWPRDVTIT